MDSSIIKPITVYCTIAETSYGWIGIVGNPRGLIRMILPEYNKENVLDQLSKFLHPGYQCIQNHHHFVDLTEKIVEYFNGVTVHFIGQALDLSHYTPFQRKILLIAREIPYGEVRTYQWLATQAGNSKACRAVGGVMRVNPLPLIIPCHRIIGSRGKLTGFSATGGIELKRRMLELEGISL